VVLSTIVNSGHQTNKIGNGEQKGSDHLITAFSIPSATWNRFKGGIFPRMMAESGNVKIPIYPFAVYDFFGGRLEAEPWSRV